jgi:hypothetical protein
MDTDVRALVLALIALMLASCSSPLPGPDAAMDDAGVDPAVDGAVPLDASDAPDAWSPPPILTTPTGLAALACAGRTGFPPHGAPMAQTINVYELITATSIPMQEAWFFSTNVIAATCAAPDCVATTTDASGEATVVVPTGLFAYHLPASDGTLEVNTYNRFWLDPPPSPYDGIVAFSRSTSSAVSTLLRRSFVTTRGAVVGSLSDCSFHPIANAYLRVWSDGVEQITGLASERGSTRISGMNGTSPTSNGLTSDGTFVAVNVVPGHVLVEAWGVRNAGDAAELISCEEGELVENSITDILMGPLRDDYAPGAGCLSPPM